MLIDSTHQNRHISNAVSSLIDRIDQTTQQLVLLRTYVCNRIEERDHAIFSASEKLLDLKVNTQK